MSVPASPAYMATAKTATPSAPSSASTTRGSGSHGRSRDRLEPRPRPPRRQRDERDDEDQRGRDAEQQRRDREVGAPDDAVREDHYGSTRMEAIWRPASSSSTSVIPVMFALKLNFTVSPGASMSLWKS